MSVIPAKVISLLKWIYAPILKAAHFLGRVNTFIILTFFYFMLLGVAKLTAILLGKDPLEMRWKDRESYWKKRDHFAIDKNSFLEPY